MRGFKTFDGMISAWVAFVGDLKQKLGSKDSTDTKEV